MTQQPNEIVVEAEPVREPGTAVAAITPMQLLQQVVQGGANIDQLGKLLDFQERWEANEARKKFAEAMVAFKADPPKIYKNAVVDFTSAKGRTNYRHATLDNVNDLISEALQKVGISARWKTEQPDGLVRVTCILTHSAGHSEETVLQAPKDDSGNKNSIQAVVSTVTYLERQTLLSATGMAVRNGGDDDGGQGEGGGSAISDAEKTAWLDQLAAARDRKGAEAIGIAIAEECTKRGDVPAYAEMRQAVTKRIKAFASPAAAEKTGEGLI